MADDKRSAERGTWFASAEKKEGYQGLSWELWDKNNDGGSLYLHTREEALELIAIATDILRAMEEDGNRG